MEWTFHAVAEFERYRPDWDRLNHDFTRTPLLSSDFVKPLLDYFADAGSRLALCRNAGGIIAVAVLTRRRFGVWETLQPAQAPIGLWLHDSGFALTELMLRLHKALPWTTLLLGITQQDPDIVPPPLIDGKFRTLDYIRTARITVEGTFDEYWSKRGKNLRQNLRRQRNLLEREGICATLEKITEPDAVEAAIMTYGALESAGWKNAGGTAIHISNDQGRFYRDMLRNFCARRRGVIFQYCYNDKPVAVDLCIRDDDSLVILKTTYDETITTSSPAMLMRQAEFEYIFAERLVKRIEFYGKVMDWHTKWSDEIRIMYHLNHYRFNFLV